MENKEENLKNNNKIDIQDNSTWKHLPIGNNMRKTYDYYNLTLNDFLNRYYKSFELQKQWDTNWMNSIIIPAYEGDDLKLAKRMGDRILKRFSSNKMNAFYNKYKYKNIFDDDILLFISWMAGMNFFENNKTDFNTWINSEKFNIGGRHEGNEDRFSLGHIANHQNGMNLIREKLMHLEWHKR